MRNKIIDRLKHVRPGYDLDKLPTTLLKAVIETAIPMIEQEARKAEERAIQKMVNERFIAKVIKTTLEQKTGRQPKQVQKRS